MIFFVFFEQPKFYLTYNLVIKITEGIKNEY